MITLKRRCLWLDSDIKHSKSQLKRQLQVPTTFKWQHNAKSRTSKAIAYIADGKASFKSKIQLCYKNMSVNFFLEKARMKKIINSEEYGQIVYECNWFTKELIR